MRSRSVDGLNNADVGGEQLIPRYRLHEKEGERFSHWRGEDCLEQMFMEAWL